VDVIGVEMDNSASQLVTHAVRRVLQTQG